MISSRKTARSGFTFVEAVFTIAIIGIMASLAISAMSNGARDANRIVARQQQAAIQEAVIAWVMGQTRVKVNGVETQQVQSISGIRTTYNTVTTTTLSRFNLLVPNSSATDASARAGYLDKTTADHFSSYTTNSDRLKSSALDGAKQYLTMPTWQDGDFPRVELVNE